MSNSNDYKTRNEIEKKLFKYDDCDLISIIIENQDLIDGFDSLAPREFKKNVNDMNHNKLVDLILDNFYPHEINREFEKINPFAIKPIIKKSFPYKNARELQLETISRINDAIEEGYKFIILEAVSGFGKSVIATALSNIYAEKKSYILTTTNQLANQFVQDFKDLEISKLNPRSSYKCKKNLKKCSAYLCKYSKCYHYNNSNFSKDFDKPLSCNYLYGLKEKLKDSIAVCTYDYFIQENFYHSNHMKTRKLLICDEGHNLDDKISNAISLKIIPKQLRQDMGLNIRKEYQYISQNEDYFYYLLKFKKIYQKKLKRMEPGSHKYITLKKKLKDIERFMKYFDKSNENLVFERDEDKNWIFKPIKLNKMIKDALLEKGDVCIFMSSSIFDHENFAFDLGINENEIFSLIVPNIFDLSENPIKIYSEYNMEGNPIETGMAKDSLKTIKQILKEHRNEKGVIHTINHEIASYIKKNIDNYRLITHNQYDREEKLEMFKNNKQPLVLVSPSMNEGVDLPGDLCRFQIIYKLPYLPFEDPWINKRKNIFEDGKQWYRYKMLTKLIQGYGRGIRFEGDHCKTYILDNRLFDVIDEDMEENEIIPKYFINAIENLR